MYDVNNIVYKIIYLISMCAGVFLNGRQFKTGTHFEYNKHIRIDQPQLAGSMRFYAIGTVVSFFNVVCRGGQSHLFCMFHNREVLGANHGLYTVRRGYSQELQTIHIDSIRRQIHLAKTIDIPEEGKEEEEGDTTPFTGIPMWDVR